MKGPLSTRRNEHGSASVELVVLMPLLLLILFSGIQGAVYYHASTLALAAAEEGARAAAREDGTLAAGTSAARGFVTEVAGDSLTAVTIVGSRTPVTATITVRGSSLSLVPGWTPSVEQSASRPVERITR